MTNNYQEIHLIVEKLNPPTDGRIVFPSPSQAISQPPALAIPPRPAWLVRHAGRRPKLTRARSGRPAGSILVEPIAQEGRMRLLLVSSGRRPVRVNGLPAPPWVVLKEKDALQLDEEFLLHVTTFNRPCIGPVPADWIGKVCPVCHVVFKEGKNVYVCPCGAVMHCESEALEDGLQCAQLRSRSGCIACLKPVVLSPCYTYVPEACQPERVHD